MRYGVGAALAGLAAIIVILVLIAYPVYALVGSFNEHEVNFTVDTTEVVTKSGNSSYLVYAEDGTVYQNTDNWLQGKTESSDLQNSLEEGESYTCTAVGFRISLLSDYENLLECEPTS